MFLRSTGQSFGNDALLEHIDGLYSYAMALSRNRSDAEDLVQETYVRAIPAAERLRKESNVKSWLFTILRNIWLNQLRDSGGAVTMSGADIDQFLPESAGARTSDAHTQLVTRLEQERVRSAIQQLPDDFREVILLREYGELSYQEIAGVLNCPIGTVMSRLGRARSKLGVLLSTAQAGDRSP
ncbi:MAG TPA: sigma-70 family RNA polymerase sigma factor [Silvibacterium sp.]|jgi:RNA polymerase sigma-70 factor (ECF subfamily)|nr:sigma-70 family RNA polymerase sigma factor [Silvibacterium sp.]